MPSTAKKLPDFELDAMLVIWRSPNMLHTGEILQLLTDKKCRIQALQSVMRRLEEKGFVKCEKIGRLNYYLALITEEDYKGQQAASLMDKLFGNSPAQLVASLVEHGSLSKEDLEEMRQVLEKGAM